MAKVEITSASTGGGSIATGVLQLLNGVAMSSSLISVTDQNNTTSPLKLSTTLVQVVSTLRITTADNPYIDAEDSAGNNRFTIGRDPSSQQVNVDFASNPTGGSAIVGAIRTYVDDVNLSEIMQFREDGRIQIGSTSASAMYWDNTNNRLGIGTNAPTQLLQVARNANSTTNVLVSNSDTTNTSSRASFTANSGGVIGQLVAISGDDVYVGAAASNVRIGANGGTDILVSTTGNVSVGSTTNLGARLGIKGSGSTSATTSLLVQNVSGVNNATFRDNGELSLILDRTGKGLQLIDNLATSQSTSYYQRGGVAEVSTSSSGLNYFWWANNNGTWPNGVFGYNNGVFIVSSTQKNLDAASSASAVLQADSTTRGFLPPRMTNAQRSAIASPAEGLQIHNTTNNGVAYYDGTNWGYLSGAKQSITITGATQTIFGGNGNIVALTMQSSTTLTFSNHVVGTYIFQITQGGTGSYTITWPVSVLWSGGTAPTLTTTVGKTDIVTLFHDGTNFYGTYSLNY